MPIMGDETGTTGDVEMQPVSDASDGGKRLEDKKTNLQSDADNTTSDVKNAQEVNGEVSVRPRGRPRKVRQDENADKNDTKMTRTRKRAFSESDDEAKFRGFEPQTSNLYPGLQIINKLLESANIMAPSYFSISDIKNLSSLPTKRIRRPTVKVLENADTEASEVRTRHSTESESAGNAQKQDTDESDADAGLGLESEADRDESVSVRRGRRSSTTKAGVKNEAYKKPFEQGWKRELVYRGVGETSQGKRKADIYYFAPNNKKLRSMVEIDRHLKTEKIKTLTTENFTFTKELIGVKKPMEMAREAGSPGLQHFPDNAVANKVASPAHEPEASKSDNQVQKKVAAKRGRPRLNPKSDSASENDTTPSPPKNKPAEVQNDAQTSTPKKGVLRKEPIKSSPMTRRSQQNQQPSEAEPMDISAIEEQQTSVTEKMIKTNKRVKRKRTHYRTNLQEPCSLRCSASAGGFPSLQCTICLCNYHAECVGWLKDDVGDNYICKNCKADTDEPVPLTSTLTPPPLIPISMLGSNPAAYKPQGSLIPLPKLQRINAEPQNLPKVPAIVSTYNSNDRKSDFYKIAELPSSLPAQNLAVMNGKKYIVIPKNNAMAVQPAITIKKEKREAPKREVVKEQKQQEQKIEPRAKTFDQFSKQHEQELMTMRDEGSSKDDTLEGVEEVGEPKLNDETNREIGRNENELQDDANTQNEERKKTPVTQVTTVSTDVDRRHIAIACSYYDVFPRVFQYLTVQELLRVSRVCRMWRDLAAHPSLWRTVRMKNSPITDWDGFAEALNRYKTQHLDLRKIIMPEGENIWAKFVEVLPKIKSLKNLKLCRCPGNVVEAVIENCPQLETFSAMSIKCDAIDIKGIKKFNNCTELRLKAITGMTLSDSMEFLSGLTQLKHLSLTSVKELGRKDIHLVKKLVNLEVLELGECSDLPANFGTDIIANLPKLERLRLEKGQGTCNTFNILEGVSQSPNLSLLELVNFDIKKGFDAWLAKCTNIKRLLIIPTYISQSATTNHMILGGVTQLKETLTNFVWGVTLELLRVTDLFVDQCPELRKRIKGDAIPVLKPIPCAELIEDMLKDAVKNADNSEFVEMERREDTSNPEVDILTLLQLQKLLLLALPTTRVKILKIPFHATWRQSLLDSAMQ